MRARFVWRAYRARFEREATELSLVRRYVNASDLVCDVGANKGSYLYWMARWSRRVVAFEPQPDLATYLRRVAHQLSLANVTVEQAAVADKSGELDLYVPTPGSPEASLVPIDGAPSIRVPVFALDEYFNDVERIAFLKVDVEGRELDVFLGADRILRKHRPVLLFECERRHLSRGSVHDCFRHLEARGYRGSFIDKGELRPVGAFDPDIHQKQAGDRFWRSPDYCNNFLFEPD